MLIDTFDIGSTIKWLKPFLTIWKEQRAPSFIFANISSKSGRDTSQTFDPFNLNNLSPYLTDLTTLELISRESFPRLNGKLACLMKWNFTILGLSRVWPGWHCLTCVFIQSSMSVLFGTNVSYLQLGQTAQQSTKTSGICNQESGQMFPYCNHEPTIVDQTKYLYWKQPALFPKFLPSLFIQCHVWAQ